MRKEQKAQMSKGLLASTPAPDCLSLDILREGKKKRDVCQHDWLNFSCFSLMSFQLIEKT